MNESSSKALFQSEIKKAKNLKTRIRWCVLLAKANGQSIAAIASILQISESSIKRYVSEFSHKKQLSENRYTGRACKLTEEEQIKLEEFVKSSPPLKLAEICSYIHKNFNISYTHSGIHDWLKRKNLLKNKKPLLKKR